MRTNWAWALLTGSLAMVGCQERSASDAQAEKLFAWSAQNPFVSENTWKGVAKLVCRPARLEVCGPEGCKQQKPKAWIEIVDPNAPMLRR